MVSAVLPYFGRHETFAPRYGWLKKAIDAVAEDPSIFSAADAPVRLGVGKNMVKAIRYWAYAFKLIEPIEHPRRRGEAVAYQPTPLGRAIFNEDGIDPYVENTATLWFLHWVLHVAPCYAPVWWVLLHELGPRPFHVDDAVAAVKRYAQCVEWRAGTDRTIRRDVQCFLQMYSALPIKRANMEDELASMFRNLGLVHQHSNEQGEYIFNYTDKITLPSELVAFCCIEYLRRRGGAMTITLPELVSEPGSPGVVFKLTVTSLATALSKVSTISKGIKVVDQAGSLQMQILKDPIELMAFLVHAIYHDNVSEEVARNMVRNLSAYINALSENYALAV